MRLLIERIQRLAGQFTHRVAFRASNEETLATGDTHVAQADEILDAFDSLGNQRSVADFSQILHGAHKMKLYPIAVNTTDEMLVDLDEFRTQLGPHTHVGEALAEIIDSDLEAAAAKMQQCLLDNRHIGNLLILGQLQHDTVGSNAKFAQQFAGMAVDQPRIEQATGRDIQKQAAS